MILARKSVGLLCVLLGCCSFASEAETAQISELRYWFDGEEPKTVSVTSGQSVTIPFDKDRRRIVACAINYQVKDDAGNWSVPHRQYFMPPAVPGGLVPSQMTFTLTSGRGNVKKEIPVAKTQSEAYIDVKDLDPGIYGMTASLVDSSDGSLIGVSNHLVNIKGLNGNTLRNIYYWLDDSLSMMSAHSGGNVPLPLSTVVNIPLSGCGVPSTDNKLSLIDGEAHIAPNYKISVAFQNSYRFITDSTARITDNSQRRKLYPLWLEGSRQHDVAAAKSDTCYWYAFAGQKGDVVNFSVRRPCHVKLFDPLAQLVKEAMFDDQQKKMRCPIASTGTHYVQISEIDKSRQVFSTLLEYVSGPTAQEISQSSGKTTHTHAGKLLEWSKPSDWKSVDNGVSFSKSNMKLSVTNVEGYREPYLTPKSGQCRAYPGNTVELQSDGYLESVIFCVKNADGVVFPRIESPNGNIEIDSITGCVEWSGFAEKAVLTLSQGQSSEDVVLPITRAFVSLSDILAEDVRIDDGNIPDVSHSPFNMLRIWSAGELLASHKIDESSRLSFDGDALAVYCGGTVSRYSADDRLILTYENIAGGDEDEDSIDEVRVVIGNEGIMFTSLPAYVGIFSLSGLTIFSEYVDDPDFRYPLDTLHPGVYIVKVDKKVFKIMIQ